MAAAAGTRAEARGDPARRTHAPPEIRAAAAASTDRVEEPNSLAGESEPPVTAAPNFTACGAAGARPRPVDPLAGLAEELSRIPPPPEPGVESRPPPRRGPRPPFPASPAGHAPDAPPALAPGDQKSVRDGATAGGRAASFAQVRGQVRWRAAGRARCSQAGAGRTGPGGFRAISRLTAGSCVAPPIPDRRSPARTHSHRKRAEPAAPGMDEFAPAPSSPRFDAMPRRPFRTDDARLARRRYRMRAGEPAASEAPEVAALPPHPPEIDRCPGRAGHHRFTRGQAGAAEIDVRQSRAGDGELIKLPPSKP